MKIYLVICLMATLFDYLSRRYICFARLKNTVKRLLSVLNSRHDCNKYFGINVNEGPNVYIYGGTWNILVSLCCTNSIGFEINHEPVYDIDSEDDDVHMTIRLNLWLISLRARFFHKGSLCLSAELGIKGCKLEYGTDDHHDIEYSVRFLVEKSEEPAREYDVASYSKTYNVGGLEFIPLEKIHVLYTDVYLFGYIHVYKTATICMFYIRGGNNSLIVNKKHDVKHIIAMMDARGNLREGL